MIIIVRGINQIDLVKQDFTLDASLSLCLKNEQTGKQWWCKVADTGILRDWITLPFEIVLAGAVAIDSQITLRDSDKGDLTLDLYGSATYSESPSQMRLIHTERARFI